MRTLVGKVRQPSMIFGGKVKHSNMTFGKKVANVNTSTGQHSSGGHSKPKTYYSLEKHMKHGEAGSMMV